MWVQNYSLDPSESASVSSRDDDIWQPSDWGPQRDALWVVIPMTILYVLIFITGLIGNACTCLVIIQHKSMRTATNYYLFSLAISDLLLLVTGLPQEIFSVWSRYPYIFGEAFCVLRGIAAETSANASVLTITAFTIERYIAICYPLLSHTMSKLSRVLFSICVVWIVAFTFALPQAMQFGIVYETRPDNTTVEEHASCIVKTVIWEHSFEVSTFVFFVAPMTLISVLYILIGLQLRKAARLAQGPNITRTNGTRVGSRDLNNGTNSGAKSTSSQINKSTRINDSTIALRLSHNSNTLASRKSAINMLGERGNIGSGLYLIRKPSFISALSNFLYHLLVAVVVAFFVCWAPFHAQRLLAIYGENEGAERSSLLVTIYYALTYISGISYFMSTCVNPILYQIMSTKFRHAFRVSWVALLRYCEGPGGGKRLNSQMRS